MNQSRSYEYPPPPALLFSEKTERGVDGNIHIIPTGLLLKTCLCINAPEGCQHGTHTNGTAYTRGTYSRVHTQTHTNTNKHSARPTCLWSRHDLVDRREEVIRPQMLPRVSVLTRPTLATVSPRDRSSVGTRRTTQPDAHGRRHCQAERVLAVIAAIQRRRRSLASYASKLR